MTLPQVTEMSNTEWNDEITPVPFVPPSTTTPTPRGLPVPRDKPARHIRVLLIEDNRGDARLIREYLGEIEGIAFDLECTDRLAAGLARLCQGGGDVVLLDLALPDSRGLATFQQLHKQAPQVP